MSGSLRFSEGRESPRGSSFLFILLRGPGHEFQKLVYNPFELEAGTFHPGDLVKSLQFSRRKMLRGFALLLAIFLTFLACPPAGFAQPRSSTKARGKGSGAPTISARDVQVRTLKNGMKVMVWPDHDIPNVALYIWFRVGSRNERPGITGLSHFFEHMMFNGSKSYPSGEFDRVMERNGGSSNAFTTEDVTAYQDWFPKSILELIFKLEADRMCCLSFDPKMVESERQVVYSERRTSVDDDNASLLDEQVQAVAFVGSPYHFPVIGWPSDIERWTLDDLREYFRIHYAPSNATMILVGDVSPDEVFRLAERHFGPIPTQPQPAGVVTQEPPQVGERRVTIQKFGQTPIVEMAFHTGSAASKDAEARDLLLDILMEGESSRLYRRLVDQDRIAIDVGAFVNPEGFDPGLIKFRVTVAPDKTPEAAEKALWDELQRIAASAPSPAEIGKAKNTRLAAYWRRMKTINSKAEALGEYEVLHGDYRQLFTAPQRYDRVTKAQIQEVARSTFDVKNRTVGVLVPEKGKTP
jgi:zinc protease